MRKKPFIGTKCVLEMAVASGNAVFGTKFVLEVAIVSGNAVECQTNGNPRTLL